MARRTSTKPTPMGRIILMTVAAHPEPRMTLAQVMAAADTNHYTTLHVTQDLVRCGHLVREIGARNVSYLSLPSRKTEQAGGAQ